LTRRRTGSLVLPHAGISSGSSFPFGPRGSTVARRGVPAGGVIIGHSPGLNLRACWPRCRWKTLPEWPASTCRPATLTAYEPPRWRRASAETARSPGPPGPGKHRNHGMDLQVIAGRTATLCECPGLVPCCPGPVATEFLHGTGIDPRPPAHHPDGPGDVVAASLTALDLGETVCIPGLGDPAAIEDYHAAARQLVLARGPASASRYLTTAVPHTQAEPRPAAQRIIPGLASPRRRRAEAGRALLRALDSPETTTRWLSRPQRRC